VTRVALQPSASKASRQHVPEPKIAPAPTVAEYEVVLGENLEQLEVLVTRAQRLEQRFLRLALLPDTNGQCDLCGGTYPAELLVAAHIKRRSVCTDDEKRRFSDVAMLNCKFGCDEMFGRGLIAVDRNGSIILSEELEPGVARDYALNLQGRQCRAWRRTGTREFFEYHLDMDFRRPLTRGLSSWA
jgi:hypothetical protein